MHVRQTTIYRRSIPYPLNIQYAIYNANSLFNLRSALSHPISGGLSYTHLSHHQRHNGQTLHPNSKDW